MTLLPKNRQTSFFSATFTQEVKQLAKELLRQPQIIQDEKANTAAKNISHIAHPVDEGKKRALTAYIIGSNNWQQVLIFTRTKVSADKLSKELHLDGIKNMVLHGDRTQAHRTKSLAHFKEGKIQALVATDIASRGIDIDNLPHVINYELPNITEDYVHRVGRTGRAGQTGHAVTLVTDKEVFRLEAVEKFIGKKIELQKVAGFEPDKFDPDAVRRSELNRRQDKLNNGSRPKMKSNRALNNRTSKRKSGNNKPSRKSDANSSAAPEGRRKKKATSSASGGTKKKSTWYKASADRPGKRSSRKTKSSKTGSQRQRG